MNETEKTQNKSEYHVCYWVGDFSNKLGWKHDDVVFLSPEEVVAVSTNYDVAILTTRAGYKLLAIDEIHRQFRTR